MGLICVRCELAFALGWPPWMRGFDWEERRRWCGKGPCIVSPSVRVPVVLSSCLRAAFFSTTWVAIGLKHSFF